MAPRYTALHSAPDPARELDEAFNNDDDDDDDDDDDEQLESTPLNHAHNHAAAEPAPGTYDFERDYDYPPPGSPPSPSAFALPNSIGNSNGQLPASPVPQSFPRPSFFRRALGGILPTYYAPVPATDSSVRVGGGVENDGVFANVMAKPGRARTVRADNGEVHVVPEDSTREAPPVSIIYLFRYSAKLYRLLSKYRHTRMPKRTPYPLTGKRPSTHLQDWMEAIF
jgi:hypothetical protein